MREKRLLSRVSGHFRLVESTPSSYCEKLHGDKALHGPPKKRESTNWTALHQYKEINLSGDDETESVPLPQSVRAKMTTDATNKQKL